MERAGTEVENRERRLFPELYHPTGGNGILPCQEIRKLEESGRISSSSEITDSQVQPSSIDLRLGRKAYRVHASFLPGRSATLRTKVSEFLDSEIDLTEATPPLLERGVVYIIPLLEKLDLPSDLQGVANPKSTTGRLDIFTRLITECGDEFDRVPRGYSGELFVEVVSGTFPIRVRTGMKLNQLRFVRGNPAPIGEESLKKLAKENHIIYDAADGSLRDYINGGVKITVDLQGDGPSSIVAYRAKHAPRPIELDKINHYDRAEFWEAIRRPPRGQLVLERGAFYLLASKKKVRVPPDHAAEMAAYDPAMGEFRVHYAGFFDPGFGYGANGEILGTKAVLEVRAYQMPILIEDDHLVGKLSYYRMASIPDRVYGSSIGSSYQQQGLALSKQFKREDTCTTNPTSKDVPLVLQK